MALVVEDGTGLSGANAFVSVATVATYAAEIGNTAWAAAATDDKEAAIVRATAYLRNEARYKWRGTKQTYAQRLPWPRSGAVEHRGLAVPESTVPQRVIDACCELAIRELATPGVLQPDQARGGAIKSESVGAISVTYADSAPAETVVTVVQGILAPLLRCDGDDAGVPYIGGVTDDAYFSVGMHDAPSGVSST